MARKTKEDSARTRELILDAAEYVFYEHGITKATIADIAERAEISRGAIYGHYKNKIEVALAMCQRALQQPYLFNKRDAYPSPLHFLRAFYLELLPGYIELGSLQRVLEILYCKCEESQENKPILDLQEKWEQRCYDETKSILREAITAQELPINLGVEIAAMYFSTLMKGLCNLIINSPAPRQNILPQAEKILDTGLDSLKLSTCIRNNG